jgi:F0F1-type ATP synthase assembly protein I
MNFSKYLLFCALGLIVTAIVTERITPGFADNAFVEAVVLGTSLAFFNALAGFAILLFALKQPPKTFVVFFMGGMIFRFILIFLFLFLLIVVLKLQTVPLTTALVANYFYFLSVELFLVVKNANKKDIE